MPATNKVLIKSNKLYDALKYLAQIVLPAAATLYFALSQIWGFPNGEQVLGTIVAAETFLGVLLGASASAYNKSDEKYDGAVKVIETEGTTRFSLELDSDPYDLAEQKEVVFRVDKSHI